MQRWIAASLAVLLLVMGGLVFAYWSYKQNRAYPVWVPLPINPQATAAQLERDVRVLKDKLSERTVLVAVSKDVGLAQKWHLTTDEEGATELGKRLFVQATDTSINIGVSGKRKEKPLSEEIVKRLMEDVKKILGVKLQPKN